MTDINRREQLQNEVEAAKRLLALKQARNSLIRYTEVTMPAGDGDINHSIFEASEHHLQIAEKLEALERGDITRLIITTPPRHGKSELSTRKFVSWFMGRNPGYQVIVVGYSEDFAAEEFGKEIRNTMTSSLYNKIFPECVVNKNSKSSTFIMTERNGKMKAVGVGGAITGKGAHLLVIDDPIKNWEDANSEAARENMMNWYMSTARTRLMPGGRILIVMTRWNEGDIVGRILSGKNASKWEVLHLKAIENEGTSQEKALWPAWYPLDTLKELRDDMLPNIWSALYQGNPSPDTGAFFKNDMIIEYEAHQLPREEELNHYIAMDLAVSLEKQYDKSCIGIGAVDSNNDIWILPDLFWERELADTVVEEIIKKVRRYRPITGWGEKGQIQKAIMPFLNRRMREENVYCYFSAESVNKAKVDRALAIRGMMAMGRVKFPSYATWWPAARNELLKFPNDGDHDDFVDMISLLGRGLEIQMGKPVTAEENVIKVGTWAWLKKDSDYRKRVNKLSNLNKDFW